MGTQPPVALTTEREALALRREAWLKERMSGIGGSEAPVVLQLSPYSTPLELYARKRGLAPEHQADGVMSWGLRLEPVILQAFGEEAGREVHAGEPYTLTKHPKKDWMFATLDARQVDPEKGEGIVQIKTHQADWRDGEPPEYDLAQLQHEIEVAGVQWGTLVCLVRGFRLVWRDYERNDKFIGGLIRREAAFWDAVQLGEPPAVSSDRDDVALAALYPKDGGGIVDLPAEFANYPVAIEELEAQAKEAAAHVALLKNQVRAAMGEASYARLSDGSGWSWKQQHREGYEVGPKDFRVLRRMKRVA